jgi:3-oxoacyl-[acyl-carrier-protein] synthase-1
MSASIVDCNAICSVGRGPEQIWASVRAGIAGIGDSSIVDSRFDPVAMGLVPEDDLPPLPPEVDELPLPTRARRMLRLGAPMLAALATSIGDEPLHLYLAVPQIDAHQDPWISSFALRLAAMAGVELDLENSRVVPAGRAGGLLALELALAALARDPSQRIVVGGVDSFHDLKLMTRYIAEDRVLGPRVMDGFIPGEGAAFYVLASDDNTPPVEGGKPVRVLGAASTRDPGHRYGTEPGRGEGLADAIEKLRGTVPAAEVESVFAGLNGESFESRLWGVAALRHKDWLAPGAVVHHPADCYGDTGAAAGGLLTVLAAIALSRGHRPQPALVWAASDHEPRGCALLGS